MRKKITPEKKEEIYNYFNKLKAQKTPSVRNVVMEKFGINNHQMLYDIMRQVEKGEHLSKNCFKEKIERGMLLWNNKYIHDFSSMGGYQAKTKDKVELMVKMYKDKIPKSLIAQVMGYKDHSTVVYHLNKYYSK